MKKIGQMSITVEAESQVHEFFILSFQKHRKILRLQCWRKGNTSILGEKKNRRKISNEHFLNNYVKSSFRLTKLRRKYRDLPCISCPHICTVSFILNIIHKNDYFSPKMTTLIHHNHLKSISYLRARSWCCIFSVLCCA